VPASPDRKAPNPNVIAIPRKPEVTTRAAQSKTLWGRVSKYSTRAPVWDKRPDPAPGHPGHLICTAGNSRGGESGGPALACLDRLMAPDPKTMRAARRVFVWLFLALNFFYLLTSSGRVRTMDEVTLDLEVESMAAHGNTEIPQGVAQGLFYGKYDRFGRPQGPYGLGNVLLVLPWYELGKLAARVAPGIPGDAKTLFIDAFTVGSSAAFSALAAAFAFLIFVRLGIQLRTAVAAALVMGLATPLFSYSSWFYSEPLASALLLGATYFLFRSDPSESASAKDAAIAGLLIGLLLSVRATHIIVVPVMVAALLARSLRENWRSIFVFGAVAGLIGAAYLTRNYHFFGSPTDFGYPRFGEGGKDMLGFDTPILTGLSIFLFSPGKSMLLFAPVVALAIPGLVRLANKDRGLAVVAAGIPIVSLLLFSRYSHVEGGYSFGPRYLIPATAVICLGLAPMLADNARWIRRTALALFLAGFVIQGIGMATSFIEDMATGAYYDANWTYRPDYSPLPRMSKRLVHYITSPTPAPVGRGFDRWFVFLAKAGVSRGTVAAIFVIELAGFGFCAWQLKKSLAQTSPPELPATPSSVRGEKDEKGLLAEVVPASTT